MNEDEDEHEHEHDSPRLAPHVLSDDDTAYKRAMLFL